MELRIVCERYADGFLDWPWVVPVDRYTCLIADQTGHLTVFNLISREASTRAFVGTELGGIGPTSCRLRSLCTDREPVRAAAVATRGGHAVWYDLDRQDIYQIPPEHYGQVGAVALSPDGQSLAIGLGYYPLSADPIAARVELWTLDQGTPTYLGFVALPGVAVDTITWSRSGDQITCTSGVRSQDRSFVATLDAASLRPISFWEFDAVFAHRIAHSSRQRPDGHLVILAGDCLRMIDLEDGREEWRSEQDERLHDFCIDEEEDQIIASNGTIVDIVNGKSVGILPPLPHCRAIAIRPGGGYIGVSTRGKVGVWE